MKKLIVILLSVCMIFAVCAVMVSCNGNTTEEKTTVKGEEKTTEFSTTEQTTAEATTVEETTDGEATVEETTDGDTTVEETTDGDTTGEETTGEEVSTEELDGMYYDEENAIYHIYDAEGLYAFGEMVNDLYFDTSNEVYYLEDCTVSIEADIDCADMPAWQPMVLVEWFNVVFDGNDHVIKNLKIEGVDSTEAFDYGIAGQKSNMDNAFIGLLYDSVIEIRNLKFEGCVVTSYGQQNAIVVGWVAQSGLNTDLIIEDCEVYDCKILGYMPYGEGAEHSIGFRCAAFIGANFGGNVTISNCRAETMEITGFHNLAAFVGYDAVNCVYLENCEAVDIDITFSYTLSSYTVTNLELDPSKDTYNKVLVDPFFCSAKWEDHLEYEQSNGNTYSMVVYHDYEDPNAPEYDPENFRSGIYNYDYEYIGKTTDGN